MAFKPLQQNVPAFITMLSKIYPIIKKVAMTKGKLNFFVKLTGSNELTLKEIHQCWNPMLIHQSLNESDGN